MRNMLFERDLVFKSAIFRVTGGVAGGWYLRRGLGLLKFTLLLCFLKLAPEDLCFLVVIMTGTNELFTKSEGPSPVMYVLLLKVERLQCQQALFPGPDSVEKLMRCQGPGGPGNHQLTGRRSG